MQLKDFGTKRIDEIGYALSAFLIAALLLGGGGAGYGFANLAVQLLAWALILSFWLRAKRAWVMSPKVFRILFAATLCIPLVHLVPLPPAIWQALPGRDLATASRELVGASDKWYPITLARHVTVTAVLGVISSAAVVILYLGRERTLARGGFFLVVVLGLANFAIGAAQVLGLEIFYLYPAVEEGRLHGFFANHNSCGLFFVIAMCSAIALLSINDQRPAERIVLWLSIALFLIGTLLTNSRSSTVLLLVPISFLFIVHLPAFWAVNWKYRLYGMGIALLGVVVVALVLNSSGRVEATIERFDDLEDARPQIWQDTVYAIDRYWPVGSGVGTFDEVYQVDESLENLLSLKAGRAHNDYLETALETGVVGPVLALSWIVFILSCVWRARRRGDHFVAGGAALSLFCIALQSAIDYPLRNQALICISALLICILLKASGPVEEKVT